MRSSASIVSLLAESDEGSPAKRAERTPGAPPSAATSRPESSASAGRPDARAAWRALISAFSTKLGAVRSEERRGGKACVSTGSSWWWADQSKKKDEQGRNRKQNQES